jgi:beta-glucanase (GH16 family)
MNRRDAIRRVVLAGGLAAAAGRSNLGLADRQNDAAGEYRLVWSDEFDGPDGSLPNPKFWTYDVGGSGWGNHELETYTNRPENAFIRNGNLVIRALKETHTGPDGITRHYTSARIKTQGLLDWTYGRFEARIKLPYGQGMWPAFWMLGSDIEKIGWPACGEIDIMENIGREPSTVHGTVHGPSAKGEFSIGAPYSLANGERFAEDYHLFAVEWEAKAIRFYVDGNFYEFAMPANLLPGSWWPFEQPFFLILNVAVGGRWPGNPDSTTVFPQPMLVDYVRVYQRKKLPAS